MVLRPGGLGILVFFCLVLLPDEFGASNDLS